MEGYLETTKKIVRSALMSKLPNFHLEYRKGTQKQAIEYCLKHYNEVSDVEAEQYFLKFEDGVKIIQGMRTDLATIRQSIEEGHNLRKLLDSCDTDREMEAVLRYNRSLYALYEPPRKSKPLSIYIYGPPGCGKTYAVTHYHNQKDVYLHITGKLKWWDGYDGHKIVVLDDFRDTKCELTTLISLLNVEGCRIEQKDGSRQIRAEIIYIISDRPPELLYSESHGTQIQKNKNIDQLLRRLDHVIEVEYTADLKAKFEQKLTWPVKHVDADNIQTMLRAAFWMHLHNPDVQVESFTPHESLGEAKNESLEEVPNDESESKPL